MFVPIKRFPPPVGRPRGGVSGDPSGIRTAFPMVGIPARSHRRAARSREGRMKRRLLAVLILAHGLAHASAGVWAAANGPLLLVTALWSVAMLGYIAAALGLMRTPVLRNRWKELLVSATI